jgi:hypothetical protein
MADDNTLRSYRPSDPFRREPAPSNAGAGGSDPLAELARLIGQSDPFAEFGRSPRSRGPQDGMTVAAAPPMAPDRRRGPAPAYDADEPTLAPESQYPRSGHQRHDPYQMSPAADAGYEPRVDMLPPADAYAHETPYRDDGRYEPDPDDAPAAPTAAETRRPHEAYFDDGAPMEPQDEEMYDDPPRKRARGSSFVTALALIGCAMAGTAGAYGYRTYHVGAGSGAAPVIVADKTPTKVVTADTTATTKVIQDRLGERGASERVVSREEAPVDVRPAGTTTTPRVVLAAPVPPAQAMASTLPTGVPPAPPSGAMAVPPAPAAGVMAAPPAAAAPPAPGDAKRVRTVPIRPDGADTSGRPLTGLAAAPPPAPAAPPAAGLPRAGAPVPKAPAPGRGGPLSLDPAADPIAPAPRERTAVVAPPAPRAPAGAAPAAAPPAGAPAAGAPPATAGGYVVQVSSQRSENEARASLRTLQAKFSGALNGQPATVRRVELGAKGVWYRALIGPFASANEASQVCNGLKAAGGQCNIQRN